MVLDAVRLAVGTLTVLPVPPPRTVDRHTWRTALALAPVVGFGLGAIAWLLGSAVLNASDSTFACCGCHRRHLRGADQRPTPGRSR